MHRTRQCRQKIENLILNVASQAHPSENTYKIEGLGLAVCLAKHLLGLLH